MLYDMLEDGAFQSLMRENAKAVIALLFDKELEFDVICNVELVRFEPELPRSIKEGFADFTLFSLTNYTYESASLKEERLVFEAGFGEENIVSVVSIPVGAIIQILVEENALFVNLSASVMQEIEEVEEVEKEEDIENSMNALLSNPENAKFKR
jgi:hypothetical protein